MEIQVVRKSYEIVPRPAVDRSLCGCKSKKKLPMPYDIAPVFGRWTRQMMSSLRKLRKVEHEAGQAELVARIEAAYYYLYTRTQERKRMQL